MPQNYYNRENHGNYELIPVGNFKLAEGGIIPNLELAIRTFGTLNEDKSNAILMTTWFSGTTKILEDAYVGKDHALNPEKYFIILVNQIGNGLSTSPWNADESIKAGKFPKVRIEDDVKAQYKLLTEHFGIQKLVLVLGGSMGAQQTYEWAVRFPDFMERAAPIAGYAKNTEHDFIFTKTLIDTITMDPAYKEGAYESIDAMKGALDRHGDIWNVVGYNPEMYRIEAYKNLGFKDGLDFGKNFTMKYFEPMDPNTLLLCAWKWQRGDVSRNTNGDLKAALGRIKCKMFCMPILQDMFFVTSDCKLEQEMIPNSEWRPIDTVWGHLGLFGMDPNYMPQVDKILNELLATEV
ncbi:alpha/beta fold hydrolase [Rhizosphaericola mali]|uniref:Alpha/beta fold hydrolase n=1 Tax=Rhizosphaericola mali TaxID=2545455 RepID=A0A5P2FYA1_9BACT|nr:alpha/beta fold hydrolase [Rhizosphaericola mali]QES88476.1 alpha/beta fold hydrolase [Rhizosphaericola mali]